MLTRKVRIDLDPNSAIAVVNCNQYDDIANCLEISLFKNSQAFNIPTNAVVKIQGTKPDMHGFQYDAKSFSGNTVVCDLTQQMTAVAGEVPTEVRILDKDENTAHTANFILQVEESALRDDTIMSDTEISGVEDLKQIVERMDDMTELVADADAAATRAEAAASNANTSANTALTSKNDADASAASAGRNAMLSESWAVGGTGTRDGEDTNNAKYYAERAASSAASVGDSAEQAAASALAAAGSATAASGSAENASASASAASTSAGNAAMSETNASNSASAAASSASDAQTKAGEAATSATNAAASESTASTAATTATTKAGEAATSATNAAASESAASTSATNAAASASAASTSETNAANSASAAANSATEAAEIVVDTVKWSERKGYVGKNLINTNKPAYYQRNFSGITTTINNDGSYTIDGISTSAFTAVYIFGEGGNFKLPNNLFEGVYTLSLEWDSEPTAGSIYFSMRDRTASIVKDTYISQGGNNRKTINFEIVDISHDYECYVYLTNGMTANNVTIYPMLRLASIEDDTYEPYIPSNEEIDKKITDVVNIPQSTLIQGTVLEDAVSGDFDIRAFIKNGICYVSMDVLLQKDVVVSGWLSLLITNLPSPSYIGVGARTPYLPAVPLVFNATIAMGQVHFVNNVFSLVSRTNQNGTRGGRICTCFNYPVL